VSLFLATRSTRLIFSVLAMTIAAEIAAARPDVKGPGTFRAALLDELYNLTPEVVAQRAKVQVVA
jgi:thiamine-phosphate diphosphorylase/hydroxyethylthiazole kinase